MSSEMTAQELIYKSLINKACFISDYVVKAFFEYDDKASCEDTWYYLKENFECCYDVEYEARYGDQEVSLTSKTSSRHYEIEVRATEVDGVWVAWDFYYGGGKHGEPEAFDWISNARIVDCEERVVTKTEYVFKERT